MGALGRAPQAVDDRATPRRALLEALYGEEVGLLPQRDDDREETVRKRLAVYHEQTKPLVNYYLKWADSGDRRAPRYANIYGRGSIEHIRDKMFAALARHRPGA